MTFADVSPAKRRFKMASRAKITVTTGPDRGKSCALTGDLTRVGRAAENDLVLTDPELADHLASIVEREGRYAIITTIPAGLEVDGTEIPVERWVWLPEEAEIRVSRRTALQFVQENGSDDAGDERDSPVAAVTAPATANTESVSSDVARPVRPAGRRSGTGSSGAGLPW
jgi:pSer/pThr/pTyr-binding forkhead associated (FHA) protein